MKEKIEFLSHFTLLGLLQCTSSTNYPETQTPHVNGHHLQRDCWYLRGQMQFEGRQATHSLTNHLNSGIHNSLEQLRTQKSTILWIPYKDIMRTTQMESIGQMSSEEHGVSVPSPDGIRACHFPNTFVCAQGICYVNIIG
jgi:hypothetical protein